jgi:hypothetical protein
MHRCRRCLATLQVTSRTHSAGLLNSTRHQADVQSYMSHTCPAVPEDGEAPPPPPAVPRHTLRMTHAGADAEPVRALSFLAGQPLPSGEALLAFGGQPADKPDALTLLPVTPSAVRRTR